MVSGLSEKDPGLMFPSSDLILIVTLYVREKVSPITVFSVESRSEGKVQTVVLEKRNMGWDNGRSSRVKTGNEVINGRH